MKKLIGLFAVLLVLSALSSCSTLVLKLPEESKSFSEDDNAVAEDTTEAVLVFADDIPDFSDSLFYATGYDGMYARLINRAYRALLDLQLLREKGTDLSIYTELEAAIEGFMEGKTATLVYSYIPGYREEIPLYMGFAEPIAKLLLLDEERFMEDPVLVELFIAVRGFNIKNGLETASDNYSKYSDCTDAVKYLTPNYMRVETENYDTSLGLISLEFCVAPGWDIVILPDNSYCAYEKYSGGVLKDGVVYVKRGEPLIIESPFVEKIFFAAINEYGIVGMHNVYYLKSVPEKIPAE